MGHFRIESMNVITELMEDVYFPIILLTALVSGADQFYAFFLYLFEE